MDLNGSRRNRPSKFRKGSETLLRVGLTGMSTIGSVEEIREVDGLLTTPLSSNRNINERQRDKPRSDKFHTIWYTVNRVGYVQKISTLIDQRSKALAERLDITVAKHPTPEKLGIFPLLECRIRDWHIHWDTETPKWPLQWPQDSYRLDTRVIIQLRRAIRDARTMTERPRMF